jgi:hypothetical protein
VRADVCNFGLVAERAISLMFIDTPSHSVASALAWGPILPDTLFDSARRAVGDIVAAVRDPEYDDGSASFAADLALLYGYLAASEPDGPWGEGVAERLNGAIDRVDASGHRWNGLFGGLAGVGWTVEHLGRLLAGDEQSEDDADDAIADIDTLLIQRLRHTPWTEPYDLVAGLVGIGIYFLERLPRPAGLEGLALVVERLDDLSESSWGGVTWHTPPRHLSLEQREMCPEGYYNLGVAHGVPGVIHLLAEAARLGVEHTRCTRLLEGALQWLAARQRPSNALSRYSSWFVPGYEPQDSRVAWCYGDLGIAAVWFHAGRAVGRDDWMTSALTLLDRTLDWPADTDRIADSPLCHGALGVAHICNRVYHSTGVDRYRAFANRWYERGLGMRQPGVGVAGFPAWRHDRSPNYVVDPTFLSGAIGVALSLEAATTSVEPNWDRLLLLSGRS